MSALFSSLCFFSCLFLFPPPQMDTIFIRSFSLPLLLCQAGTACVLDIDGYGSNTHQTLITTRQVTYKFIL